jgi:DNA gyrase/topoisomerase IV subunit A
MAFLFRHTDLQINFPVNTIAITHLGVPERLSLDKIIRSFLDFRYETTTARLRHKLALLLTRIHLLVGFDLIFQDLDRAIAIIRAARSRKEAESGLKAHFPLDDEQVEAILEMRLYKLIGMEIGKIIDELTAKRREAAAISRDLESPQRLWSIVDRELTDVAKRFADERRTRIVHEPDSVALAYDPEVYVEHEDATVILSRQGWIRRMKSTVEDPASLKFREGDDLFGMARVNTSKTVAVFSNLGKVYVLRVLDLPSGGGFGEPIGKLLNLGDGEQVVGFIAPDPVLPVSCSALPEDASEEDVIACEDAVQVALFRDAEDSADEPNGASDMQPVAVNRAVVVTRLGKGFRFEFEILREPTKRIGRKLLNLQDQDEVVAVRPEDRGLVAVAVSSGHVVIMPADDVPVMSGAAQGVRMVKIPADAGVVSLEVVDEHDNMTMRLSTGEERVLEAGDLVITRRGTAGKRYAPGIASLERHTASEVHEA